MPFPLDMQFIRQTEAKLGRTLPATYVKRMCLSNGGEVPAGDDEFILFPILDSSDRKRLARTCNDIIRETGEAKKWHNFPAEALAIGDNGGGDKLVLMPDAHSLCFAEAVYWWDHENG